MRTHLNQHRYGPILNGSVEVMLPVGFQHRVIWLASRFVRRLEGLVPDLTSSQAQLQERVKLLEARVEERTAELEESRASLARTRDDLVIASNQAGMAEVATNLLHNVANALNSVSVATSTLQGQLADSRSQTLCAVVDLMLEKGDDLPRFLAEDERGRRIPELLQAATQVLLAEHTEIGEELNRLDQQVRYTTAIISTQQAYARGARVAERVLLHEVVKDAISLHWDSLAGNGIRIEERYEDNLQVVVEKNKVLQILSNLFSNAREAMGEGSNPDRVLTLVLECREPGWATLEARDTGVGVLREDLDRVFAFGWTTKVDGHGFGLHGSSTAARELGGTLAAHSDGLGEGATFTLTLPLEPAQHGGSREPLTVRRERHDTRGK